MRKTIISLSIISLFVPGAAISEGSCWTDDDAQISCPNPLVSCDDTGDCVPPRDRLVDEQNEERNDVDRFDSLSRYILDGMPDER